tara:strand:- start:303 stop:599 length:297 start_codon:yes stop_codon:yes gene_type:complete
MGEAYLQKATLCEATPCTAAKWVRRYHPCACVLWRRLPFFSTSDQSQALCELPRSAVPFAHLQDLLAAPSAAGRRGEHGARRGAPEGTSRSPLRAPLV